MTEYRDLKHWIWNILLDIKLRFFYWNKKMNTSQMEISAIVLIFKIPYSFYGNVVCIEMFTFVYHVKIYIYEFYKPIPNSAYLLIRSKLKNKEKIYASKWENLYCCSINWIATGILIKLSYKILELDGM